MSVLTTPVCEHGACAWTLDWSCPACGNPLGAVAGGAACPCGFVLRVSDGIWRALPPQRLQQLQPFLRDYTEIRRREGRGSDSSSYYLALPYADLTGRNSWQWAIRARTFDYFMRRLLPRIERRVGQPLRILDLGAGNGWLSYRLALRGHRCAAVDLLDDPFDGLGSAHHYLDQLAEPFLRVQAEMDALPFAGGQFDAVIYNAAFHYSEDYKRTLQEAFRCLVAGGQLLILDTAFYRRDESGRAMVREREAEFRRRYGFASNQRSSREYLTSEILAELAHEFGLTWSVGRPWYGWRWAMRPWIARLRRRREPSRFFVFRTTRP